MNELELLLQTTELRLRAEHLNETIALFDRLALNPDTVAVEIKSIEEQLDEAIIQLKQIALLTENLVASEVN